ncbi:unnamed protein product [Meloidogyne enterolobii]|uniref:Uncharacterized protein n=1 Tax=Meloidogyne enterolobii TaxID=390850 RepID=A0ACB0ZCY9_MELEN
MGEISDKTKIGIITYIDRLYNYVWNTKLGPLELRFPLNPNLTFEPGDVVRYVQSHDGLAPQIVHNLLKHEKAQNQLKIVRSPRIHWKVEVNLVFASHSSREYREAMENDDEDRLKGIAWAQDFLLVASYLDNVEYEEGVVYRAYITRIPHRWEPLARKIGTIFAVLGRQFEKCTDPEAVKRFWSLCTWKDMFNSSEETDIGLPLDPNSDSRGSASNNRVNQNDFERQNVYEEQQENSNFVETLHDSSLSEGEEKIGLVVICKKEYSVIWNPFDDLVRVQFGQHQNDGDNQLPIWPLCEWVKYRCMPEESQIANGVVCKYTAYDIKKTKALKDVTLLKNENVAVKCNLSSGKAFSSEFFTANDSFFQSVLCSCKDRVLKEQMEDDDASIDVYAIFTDAYKHNNRWMAFAFRDKDYWRKIVGLPLTVDSQVQPFFTRFENRATAAFETMNDELLGTNRFKAPTDWKGYRHDGEKIIDAIGVVVCFEDDGQTSVIATKFGLARQPTELKLGVWVVTTIVPDERPPQLLKNKIRDLGSYIVKRSKKTGPLMSTRVVNDKGINKLLLCCPVVAEASKIFRNEYLGKIYDLDNLMRPQQNGQFCSSGYLVELCFSRSGEDKSLRFWKILKNHGEYNKTVNCVALKLSHFPHEMGLTCDDAHTILLDQIYDEDELSKQNKSNQQNITQQNNIDSSILNQNTSNSYNWESSKENHHFANTLPYQLPKVSDINIQKANLSERLTSHQQASPSKSLQSHKPASRIVSNHGTDDCSKLIMELNRYQPAGGETKRQLGIVVAKTPNFAILFTRLYGDAIVLPRYMNSQEEFDQLFVLGRFIGATFSRVNEPKLNELTYQFMCLPEYKLNKRQLIETRVVLGQFVLAFVTCNFRQENIRDCTEEMKENTETEQRQYIETELGNVLLVNAVIDYNDLRGKVVDLWLSHIQKSYGCYWQIYLSEKNMLQNNLKIDEIKIIEDSKLENKQKFEYVTSNYLSEDLLSNNIVLQEQNYGINKTNLSNNFQQQNSTAKSLSGLVGYEKPETVDLMGQKQPSLLPNFGDDPPIPDQKNSILKPIPSKLVEDYNQFWHANFPDTIPFNNDSSSHASAESSQHYFSDLSSNLGDRDLIIRSTPPPTIENNFGKTLQQQQKQNINKNNLQSQSWDDIGLGNDLFGMNSGSDDSDFLVKNTQHCQQQQSMVGTSNSLLGNNNLNNNNNASKSINKFEGPIGFDCEAIDISSREETKNNRDYDDLIML